MSELRANTLSDAAGTGPVTLTGQSAAKAWVNLNGTGTVATRDSYNVSSLTDNGTGAYSIGFTNAWDNVNYSASGAAGSSAFSTNVYVTSPRASVPTTSATTIGSKTDTNSPADSEYVQVSYNGDLA